MRSNWVEAILGAVVLGAAIFIMSVAFVKSDLSELPGYNLSAKFDRIDGLAEGADIRVSGIKVGTVIKQVLDKETYLAKVILKINRGVMLPEDSTAEIASEGLLGGRYLAIVPGGSDDMLKPGGSIKFTQSAVSLESLIGQLIFSSKEEKKESK